MLITVEHGRFFFYAGRDHCRLLPASFYVAWREKEWRSKAEANRGLMIPVVWSIEASWEWLPRLYRRYQPMWHYRACYASAWTGRDCQIIGARWGVCATIRAFGKCWGFSLGRLWGVV